ncbi:unnamed protein product (macronuclear) [Paramecium tetraurelia]|uniref:ubiquitinyl hydrolase 1 n=1 Tax=Paramecium tetraurelia TaxID=5888 RepID=A0EAM2_PARTE|nr:uncharacterized protein GSPATT00025073001 [Paramecium tetraurelia]CAK92339.1 unnamed protein product [Paramecium tetraurelia]|eukprot:XP_001459736.1 hypothetical protein (macronuclear) [Paramecium tetraurelia strain d4-2]
MNQQNNVPKDVMDFYLDMKIKKERIQKCWQQSGGNEYKMQDLIFQPEEEEPQQGLDFFEATLFDKRVSNTILQVIKKTPREQNTFVGIQNLGNDSIVNIMLQLLHQIPQLYQFILRIQSNNQNVKCIKLIQKQGQFLRRIQLLLTELSASNCSVISTRQLLNANLWSDKEKECLEFEKEPVIIFFNLLQKIDQSYRELVNNEQGRNDNIVMNELFYSTVEKNLIQEKEFFYISDMKECSVYSFLYEQYKQKVSVLPQIIAIQIKRNQKNNIRNITILNLGLDKTFEINQTLQLDFLKPNYKGQQGDIQISQFDDLESLQKAISNFNYVIEMLNEEGNQQDMIKILQSKQNTLEKQQNKHLENIQKQKETLQSSYNNNNNTYQVHSITIQKGYSQSNSSTLYVQYFKFKKWLKFSNSICQVVEEEEVSTSSQKYAIFATYINANTVPQYIKHQENLIEIGNLVSGNINYDINQNKYLRNLIPNDVLFEVHRSNLENRQQF